jgi:hypothetical protein
MLSELRILRPAFVALVAQAVVGCGGHGSDAATGDDKDLTQQARFVPTPHAAPPQVSYNGGPLLKAVEIVTITWSGDPLESSLQAFDAWLPQSDYFTGALAEYTSGRENRLRRGRSRACSHDFRRFQDT